MKLVIVTGGANGIGLAITKAFLDENYRVAIVDMNEQAVSERAQQLGENCIACALDITDETAVSSMVADLSAKYGSIDALVNNAGIGDSSKETVDQEISHFQKVMKVHVEGAFLMSREVAKVMMKHGGGAIVNISSITGLVGLAKRNAYGAAKAGVVSMTRSMATEWAHYPIRINAVAPGYVKTDLVQKLIQDGAVDEEKVKGRTPLGRMAKPEEIAAPIVFLCSDQASYITGCVLPVDGGWCANGNP